MKCLLSAHFFAAFNLFLVCWGLLLGIDGFSVSAQAQQPPGTFRLLIETNAPNEKARSATLHLECPGGELLELEHVGALRLQSGWNPDLKTSNRTATITLSLTPESKNYQVLVGVKTAAHSPGSGMSVTNANLSHYELEPAQLQKVKEMLAVSATNGLYRWNTPLTLGTFLDKPLQVTINRKREEN